MIQSFFISHSFYTVFLSFLCGSLLIFTLQKWLNLKQIYVFSFGYGLILGLIFFHLLPEWVSKFSIDHFSYGIIGIVIGVFLHWQESKFSLRSFHILLIFLLIHTFLDGFTLIGWNNGEFSPSFMWSIVFHKVLEGMFLYTISLQLKNKWLLFSMLLVFSLSTPIIINSPWKIDFLMQSQKMMLLNTGILLSSILWNLYKNTLLFRKRKYIIFILIGLLIAVISS